MKKYLLIVIFLFTGCSYKTTPVVVAFKKGNLATEINLGDTIDLAYTLTINRWNGYENLELKVVDMIKVTNS